MIAIVHSIYSQSVHALALNTGLMDNDAERYCSNPLNRVILLLKEYSEDSNSEPDVDLENQYYNSKALKEEDPTAALDSFQKVKYFPLK